MFEKNDKRRLYWLIEQYLKRKIDESVFCDEFYESYTLEISDRDLNEQERKEFSELDKVCSRFSEFDEDHELDKNAFYTKEQLREKIWDVKKELKLNS